MSIQHDPRTTFINHFGGFVTDEGLSPIAGRIFATLHYDGCLRSLSDIAVELGVSRASVSTNARELAAMGLLMHIRNSTDRRDYYRVAPNAFSAVLAGMQTRLVEMTTFLQGIDAQQSDPQRSKRLKPFIDFHLSLTEVIRDFEEHESPKYGSPRNDPAYPD